MALLLAAVIGALLGPLLWVTIASFARHDEVDDEGYQANQLLEDFDELEQHPIALASIDPNAYARGCGYDAEQLFGEDRTPPTDTWSPSNGYWDLALWVGSQSQSQSFAKRVAFIDERFSDFELRFLRGCIRSTVFAGACRAKIRNALDSAGQLNPNELPNAQANTTKWEKSLCAYLDGIAARRGQRLADQVER